MKLLLTFLLLYFVYRYVRYLMKIFGKPKTNNEPTQTIRNNNNSGSAPNHKPLDGEYVDYEEVKD